MMVAITATANSSSNNNHNRRSDNKAAAAATAVKEVADTIPPQRYILSHLVIAVRPLGVGAETDALRRKLLVEVIEDFGEGRFSGIQINLARVECRIGRRRRTEQVSLEKRERALDQVRDT